MTSTCGAPAPARLHNSSLRQFICSGFLERARLLHTPQDATLHVRQGRRATKRPEDTIGQAVPSSGQTGTSAAACAMKTAKTLAKPRPSTRPLGAGCLRRAGATSVAAAKGMRDCGMRGRKRTSAPSSASSCCSQLSCVIWFSAPRFLREGSSVIVALPCPPSLSRGRGEARGWSRQKNDGLGSWFSSGTQTLRP